MAQREREELWEDSVRRDRERRHREIRAEWLWAIRLKDPNHSARIAEDYERRAEEPCEEGGA